MPRTQGSGAGETMPSKWGTMVNPWLPTGMIAAVIPRLTRDIRNDLPEIKGFSERNIKRMTQFYCEYPTLLSIGPLPVAQLEEPKQKGPLPVAQLSSGWNIILPQLAAKLNPAEKAQRLVAQLPWAHNIIRR